MEKRGSKYLRFALYNATKYVCKWDSNFAAYLAKKRSEGKPYFVYMTAATNKFLRRYYAKVNEYLVPSENTISE